MARVPTGSFRVARCGQAGLPEGAAFAIRRPLLANLYQPLLTILEWGRAVCSPRPGQHRCWEDWMWPYKCCSPSPPQTQDRMKPKAIESLTPLAMHFSFPQTSPDLISSFSAYECTKFLLDREDCPPRLLTKGFLSLWPLGTGEAVVPCL